MNDIINAKTEDIFVDDSGKLWRVVATWSEPTIIMREVEPMREPGLTHNPKELHGGITGCMWEGFKRIHRPKRSE